MSRVLQHAQQHATNSDGMTWIDIQNVKLKLVQDIGQSVRSAKSPAGTGDVQSTVKQCMCDFIADMLPATPENCPGLLQGPALPRRRKWQQSDHPSARELSQACHQPQRLSSIKTKFQDRAPHSGHTTEVRSGRVYRAFLCKSYFCVEGSDCSLGVCTNPIWGSHMLFEVCIQEALLHSGILEGLERRPTDSILKCSALQVTE